MDHQVFAKFVSQFQADQNDLLKVKGGEYAGTLDRLANFRRGAALTGVEPMTCLFIYMSKHYDAIATYVKDGQTKTDRPRSEHIRGRLLDLANYAVLAAALLDDANSAVEPSEVPPFRR